jgi:hypothetical protein
MGWQQHEAASPRASQNGSWPAIIADFDALTD